MVEQIHLDCMYINQSQNVLNAQMDGLLILEGTFTTKSINDLEGTRINVQLHAISTDLKKF